MLSLLAGALGILLSWWLLRYLVVQMAPSMLGTLALLNVAPDRRVLAYTLCLSTVTAIGFGLAPALAASKPNLIVALKDGAASGGHLRQSRIRDLMLGTQVAVCLVLLIATGLLTRSSSPRISRNSLIRSKRSACSDLILSASSAVRRLSVSWRIACACTTVSS